MSLKTRVEGYVGSISNTTLLADMLTASTKYVLNVLPDSELESFSDDKTVSSSGMGIQAYRLLGVSKDGYLARKISSQMSSHVTDYGSIHYASTTDPVYYIKGGSIFIAPGGGTVTVTTYPTVDGNQAFIYGLPQGLDEAVIILTSIKYMNNVANGYIGALNSLSFVDAISPAVVAAPSFTYTDAIADSVALITIADFGNVPTYTQPVAAMPSVLSALSTITALTIPALPTAPDFSYVNASLSEATAVTVGDLGTAPTYIKPTISLTSAPTDLTISSTAPTTPAVPSYSYSSASIGTYTATTIGSLGTAPTYTKPPTTVDWTDFGVVYANDDVELAQVQIAKESNLLNNYSQDIQNELNEFQRELSVYQSTVQNAIRQAELDQERLMTTANKTTDLNIQNEAQTLSAAISLYKDTLQKYSEDLNLYSQSVNVEIQEWQSNLSKWQTLRQTELAQFNADIQNELNEFQKELAIYQSTVQAAIQDAQMAQQKAAQDAQLQTDLNTKNNLQQASIILQEYTAVLQKFQEDIGQYSANATALISEFNANLQRVEGDRNAVLTEYRVNVENNLNKFNEENVAFQSRIQKAIQQTQLDIQRLSENARLSTDVSIKNESETLQQQLQEYQSKLIKFQGDVQMYTAEVTNNVQKFSTRSQNLIAQTTGILNQIQTLERQLSLLLGKYLEKKQI